METKGVKGIKKNQYHLSWDIIERAQPYPAATNRFKLCIAEKYFIIKTSLNKRREIFTSCSRRKKHLLQNFQWPGNEKQKHKVGTAIGDPKRAENKRHLCRPLETPVSYEKNLR